MGGPFARLITPCDDGSLATIGKGPIVKRTSKYAYLLPQVRKLSPGEVYIATKGADFVCEPISFQSVVYALARLKGGGWRATTVVISRPPFRRQRQPEIHVAYAFYKCSDYMRPNLAACPVVLKLKG